MLFTTADRGISFVRHPDYLEFKKHTYYKCCIRSCNWILKYSDIAFRFYFTTDNDCLSIIIKIDSSNVYPAVKKNNVFLY